MSREIEALITQLNDQFADSFMKPELFVTDAFAIDGNQGVFFIAADEIALDFEVDGIMHDFDDLDEEDQNTIKEAYRNLTGSEDVFDVEKRSGVLYRLSASGYMDSTDYSFAPTKKEAILNMLAEEV